MSKKYVIRLLEDDMVLTNDYNPYDPSHPSGTGHRGIDFISHKGKRTVISPAAGEVVTAFNGCSINGGMGTAGENCGGGRGNYVKIYHGKIDGKSMYSLFYHFLPGSMRVTKGQKVKRGTPLGTYGNTGMSMGAHLHYEIWIGEDNRAHTDPNPFLTGKRSYPGEQAPAPEKLKWINDNRYLNKEEQLNNAKIIYRYFNKQGWSFNSIMAMLGNMSQESTMSPGLWEGLVEKPINGDDHTGYGLTQWTPYSKIVKWQASQKVPLNDGDGQLRRIKWEHDNEQQWIPVSDFNHMKFQDFSKSNESISYLVEAFTWSYERPSKQWANMEKRHEMAQYFANELKDWDPEGGGGGGEIPMPDSTDDWYVVYYLLLD